MEDKEVERHLLMALIELDLIREEYLNRKNRQASDNISRIMMMITKGNIDLSAKWTEEQHKWKP
jgi:hypothetical protein